MFDIIVQEEQRAYNRIRGKLGLRANELKDDFEGGMWDLIVLVPDNGLSNFLVPDLQY